MIILIAEAKTMARAEHCVNPQEFVAHCPAGEQEADEVMARIAAMEVSDIAKVVRISYDMAAGLKRMAYEFPNKMSGMNAIEAYTGVVFRNLDYAGLSSGTRERCSRSVRIVSSLYGYLKPDDIIKPYRLEYTSPLGKDDRPMSAALKEAVTYRLLNELSATGDREILNLLPADAEKCFDWQRIRSVAKVAKVDFRDTSGQNMRSPHAGKLKAFRGQLLRNILEHHLMNLQQVSDFRNDDMMPADQTREGSISFYV